jgi:CspA family cold shock protein
MRTLRQNQRVNYELQQDNRGKMSAVNLSSADEAAAGDASDASDAGDAQAE